MTAGDVSTATAGRAVRARRLRGSIGLVAYPLFTLAALIVLWEVATRSLDIPTYLLPPPGRVMDVIAERREVLLHDAWVTGYEAVLGFVVAVVVGCLLAVLIAFSDKLAKVIYPILISTNAVPKVAIAPLFVVWLGFGLEPKVAIAFMVAFFPVVINTVVGLQAVPEEMVTLARSMGGGWSRTFWKIRVPYALPSVFGGLKIAITLAVIGAIVGEFVAANEGLGYAIQVATASLQTAVIFANLVVLTVLALALYGTVVLLTWAFTPGRRSPSGAAPSNP
jgi:NitT/TauT family transport system permease protein